MGSSLNQSRCPSTGHLGRSQEAGPLLPVRRGRSASCEARRMGPFQEKLCFDRKTKRKGLIKLVFFVTVPGHPVAGREIPWGQVAI